MVHNATSVHGQQLRSTSAPSQYLIHCFQHEWANRMFNILHLWMLFFRCIVFLSKSWEIFYHVPNSTLENLKPIQLHGKVYDPSNSIPQACMFIFSVRETLASEGGWVCHKNTLLVWYSRGYTFGFLSSIALTFNKRLIFRYLIYKHKCTHHMGTKRHSKHLASVSMCYLRHLDSILKKWHFSRQLPFKQLHLID